MAETNTVPFKTVKEYQEYMNGTPDDDRTLRHNPPPTDGMTLSELGQKSDEEILAIINEMGKCEKKSDIRVMYCSGYAFSWMDLTVVANFRGFNIKTPPGQRKVQYSLPNSSSDEETINNSKEQLALSRRPDAYSIEKKLYISKETAEMLKTIFIRESTGKPYENSTKSRILSAIAEAAIIERYKQKKAGKLKIIAKEEEL